MEGGLGLALEFAQGEALAELLVEARIEALDPVALARGVERLLWQSPVEGDAVCRFAELGKEAVN